MAARMGTRTVKALVRAVRFRDFTRWRLSSAERMPVFSLDLGYGYTLVARPDPDAVARRTVYELQWSGRDSELRLDLDRAELSASAVVLSGTDCGVRLLIPDGFDTDGYVRRRTEKYDGSVHQVRIGGIVWETDIAYDGTKRVWSGSGAVDIRAFDPDLVDSVLYATCCQELGFLEDLEGRTASMGPVSLTFLDLPLAEYCAEVSVRIEGGVDGVLGYRMLGSLTSGSGGIVIRGRGATFAIDADVSCFGEGVDAAYLAEHGVPVWSAKRYDITVHARDTRSAAYVAGTSVSRIGCTCR